MNREDIKDQLSKKMARTLASTLLRHLKTSESFRYQLKRLCNVLSWSVSLMYQLVIATTSQIDWLYFNTSETLQKRLKQVRLIDVPVETLSVMIFLGGTRQVHFLASPMVQSHEVTNQYVAATSQRRRSHLDISCDVSATC